MAEVDNDRGYNTEGFEDENRRSYDEGFQDFET